MPPARLRITPIVFTNRRCVVLAQPDTTAAAARPLRLRTRSCPALSAPVPCLLALADGLLGERTAEAAGCPEAGRWAALATHLRSEAGGVYGGPESHRRTASGTASPLA